MRDRLLYFILLLVVLMSFTACDKVIYDQVDTNSEPKVYLSVSTRAVQSEVSLRSSINQDVTLAEDSVYRLAMLIFDSATGAKLGEYFRSDNFGSGVATYAFTVELTPGKRDFYFVANMSATDLQSANITDRNAMETFLKDPSRLMAETLYTGASKKTGFPMSRIYLNQVISEGGTIYQPIPFRPKQYETEENKVIVNTEGYGTVEKPYVELIRVVAKLEVILDSASDLVVDKIYFRNANRHFRLIEFVTLPTDYFNDISRNSELRKLNGGSTYVYYMPESIFNSPKWTSSGDNKPINFFTIKTKDGIIYDVPIISNESTITTDYLSKAKGTFTGFTPNYNILRNHHYKLLVRIQQKIEIIYEVEPWNLVNKSIYMGYGYNVEVDNNGNITITNTIDDCMPHKLRLVAKNGAYFGTPGNTTVEFGFSSTSETGFDTSKLKSGYTQSFQVNKDDVTVGQPYLEVYYNKLPGASVTADKIFTK
ncbi:MAG: fimbrial protein [Dysgonamonadaceae bacterium]